MPAPNPLAIFAPGLNQAGLWWMAVGSIASSTYGEFRTTNDVDLVVLIEPAQAEGIAAAFPLEKFYCPPADVIKLEAGRCSSNFWTRSAISGGAGMNDARVDVWRSTSNIRARQD